MYLQTHPADGIRVSYLNLVVKQIFETHKLGQLDLCFLLAILVHYELLVDKPLEQLDHEHISNHGNVPGSDWSKWLNSKECTRGLYCRMPFL